MASTYELRILEYNKAILTVRITPFTCNEDQRRIQSLTEKEEQGWWTGCIYTESDTSCFRLKSRPTLREVAIEAIEKLNGLGYEATIKDLLEPQGES